MDNSVILLKYHQVIYYDTSLAETKQIIRT